MYSVGDLECRTDENRLVFYIKVMVGVVMMDRINDTDDTAFDSDIPVIDFSWI